MFVPAKTSSVDNSTNPKVRERAKAYPEALPAVAGRQAEAIDGGVATAHALS
jgi:hypothetical protein